jgi:ATP-dependent DNA helicase RecG
MTSPKEIADRIEKVLQLERHTGYQDTAVLGGLEGFIRRVADQLPASSAAAWQQRVSQYGTRRLAERREIIRELEDLLSTLELAEPPAASEASSSPLPADDALRKSIRYAKGVGEQRAKLLKRLGIETLEDLLFYLPRRIEDRSALKKIAQLQHGERATVQGRVRALDVIKPRPNLEITKVAIQDNTGVLYAVWFNQPWLKSQFAKGERISLYGPVERLYGGLQMSHPVWEPADAKFLTGGLVPIYPATQGITPSALYRLIRENYQLYQSQISEILPADIRARQELLPRSEALRAIHFPKTLEEFEQARKTLAFEEFFIFQLGVARERQKLVHQPAAKLALSDAELAEFTAALPFRLTAAQARALEEIRRDLAAGHPMNRLLQGDVGSGKTVVAAGAAYIAIRAGRQAALMAPTEILAQQHYERLKPLFEPLGTSVALLIGSLPPAAKDEIQRAVASGELDLVVGTHALISEGVQFSSLGLAIIDEQHRFGVIQRAELEAKGEHVHVLVMSATPIPRTITLTLYGQFEITILDELPHPKEIRTYWISEDKREEVYRLVAKELAGGAQAYVVYPLIEESEELDLRAATQMKEELERTFFRELRVGLLHGRMSDDAKRRVMEQIRRKELDVLVSTTIIEVGIDVPDASLLIIEHAERFGLSQLHQLRGRIGRMGQRSLCFAIATAKTEEARHRLEAFRDLSDGFDIAEEDLKIRGPGELLGLSQHGLDTTFKVADLIRDLALMKAARDEAFQLIQHEPHTPLMAEFQRRFGSKFDLARV